MRDVDLKVIWLHRDPRAQINSAIKYNDWSVEEASKRWLKEMNYNKTVLDKWGIDRYRVSYEELCGSPEQEMQKLLQFIGLDATNYDRSFRNKKQHIMGNYAMRLGSETTIEERLEWKSELSDSQIKTIENITATFDM